MSARDELVELAGRRNYPSRFVDADRILARYAHELAEFIRKQGSQHGHTHVPHEYVVQINSWAADLIDPGVAATGRELP